MDEKPQYKHNCDKCRFLGPHEDLDLYFCLQGGGLPTVIARYGDNEPDYKSGLHTADYDDDLGEARKRAVEAGFLASTITRADINKDKP